MYTIYALVDPRDYTIHYVGQTTDVYQRFSQHINGEGGSFSKNAWIFELRALNRMIIMETLEEVDTYQAAIGREIYWIKHFEMLREPLTNATHRGVLKKVKKTLMRASRQVAYQAFAAVEARSIAEVLSPLPEDIPVVHELPVNAFVKVTVEQKEVILKAIIEMKDKGLKVNRTSLRDYLNWNSRHYEEILKPALDDMGLYMKEVK